MTDEERVRLWAEFFEREQWGADSARRMKRTLSYQKWTPQEWLDKVRTA